MSLLVPSLLFGVLGVALPVIAHILNNHKYQETNWAAMQFLNDAIRVRSKEIRVRDILLLILRCLIVLLLVLAVCQPVINKADGIAKGLGEVRAGVIIAIDASYSMQHSDGKQTRFQKAIQKVEEITANINPGDPVTLVMLGAEHKVLIESRTFNPDKFAALLAEQKAGPEALDLDSLPRRLKVILNDMEAPQKEIYIVTDLQEQDWKEGVGRLRHALKDLSGDARVYLLPVTGDQENLAVTKLEMISGVLRKGTTARYSVTVHNYGVAQAQGVKVNGKVNNITVDSKVIPQIAGGTSKTISLFIPFQNPGPAKISAEIKGDKLEIDNVRRTVAIIRNKVSVLCIENAKDKTGSFRGFISSALMARDTGEEEKDFSVKSIPWIGLPAENLDNYDVVVLADVPTITEEQAKLFDKFVRKGNGLIWFPGESTKIEAWNKKSIQQGAPLLPAVIESVASSADAMGVGKPISPNIPEHTVVNPLLSLSEDLLSEARFNNLLQVEANPSSITILTLAGTGSPLLLEHSHGRGQVFMFTSSAEPTWNTVALTPIFPMLLQQMVTYLTSREFEKPRVVGSSLSLSYVNKPDVEDTVFDTPGGESVTVPVQKFRDQYRAVLGYSKEVGYYMARGSLQSPAVPIAVNVNTKESNIKCIPNKEQLDIFEDTGVSVIQTSEQLSESLAESRSLTSYWRTLAIACLLFMLIESLLALRLPKAKNLQAASNSAEVN